MIANEGARVMENNTKITRRARARAPNRFSSAHDTFVFFLSKKKKNTTFAGRIDENLDRDRQMSAREKTNFGEREKQTKDPQHYLFRPIERRYGSSWPRRRTSLAGRRSTRLACRQRTGCSSARTSHLSLSLSTWTCRLTSTLYVVSAPASQTEADCLFEQCDTVDKILPQYIYL